MDCAGHRSDTPSLQGGAWRIKPDNISEDREDCLWD